MEQPSASRSGIASRRDSTLAVPGRNTSSLVPPVAAEPVAHISVVQAAVRQVADRHRVEHMEQVLRQFPGLIPGPITIHLHLHDGNGRLAQAWSTSGGLQ